MISIDGPSLKTRASKTIPDGGTGVASAVRAAAAQRKSQGGVLVARKNIGARARRVLESAALFAGLAVAGAGMTVGIAAATPHSPSPNPSPLPAPHHQIFANNPPECSHYRLGQCPIDGYS
jgi:hypothetical protein